MEHRSLKGHCNVEFINDFNALQIKTVIYYDQNNYNYICM